MIIPKSPCQNINPKFQPKARAIKLLYILIFFIITNNSAISQPRFMNWIKPQNLDNLNTKADDFSPSYNRWSNKLYYNSTIGNKSLFYFCDFISTKEISECFSTPKLMTDQINRTSKNQTYITFQNEETAYFTSFAMTSEGSVMNIFQSRFLKNNWQKGELVRSLKSDFFRFNPTVSPSGKTMIYSEADPKNPEDSDLWMAYLNDKNEWVGNVKLDELNSNLSEITPFLASDDTLYFASNGFNGKGGFDIYYSLNYNGKWQTPRPMQDFNTEFDESDFIRIDSNIAIFASNRPGGKGGLDLWASKLTFEQNIYDEPELKLATSITEIEVTKYRKFILADKQILNKIKLSEARFSEFNDKLIKIYADSFDVKPKYLEITVYPKFVNDFSKVEIRYDSEKFKDSFLIEDEKNNSITRLINLEEFAASIYNQNQLMIYSAIVNDQDNHSAEKSKTIDIFNSTKETPEEVKLNGSRYFVRILSLPENITDESLAATTELAEEIRNSYPVVKKLIIQPSINLELNANKKVKDWCKTSFYNIKEILFQDNIFPNFPYYLSINDFNYLVILIQI